MAGLPVPGADVIAGVGECSNVVSVLGDNIPANVVAMSVGHHHHVHIFGLHSVSGEVVKQLAPGRVRSGLGTQPGVHRDCSALRADDKAREIEADAPAGAEVILMPVPVLFRYRWEEVAEVEFQQPVGERSYLHVADVQLVAGHFGPPEDVGLNARL